MIDKGGFGEVWLAENEFLGTLRAVKIVRREKAGDKRHFEFELKAIKSYESISRKHESLLQILQVGQRRGYFYYVMELADDESRKQDISLQDYRPRTLAGDLKKLGNLPLETAVALGIELASALEFLHTQKPARVHRDIKPANIVYIGGNPKLGDPGLMTSLDRSQISQPGSPRYMDKETHGTALGDIYSLGVTLRELIELSLETRDDSSNTSMPVSESHQEPELLAEFHRIVQKASAKKDQRYQSARELREDLNNLQTKLSKSKIS